MTTNFKDLPMDTAESIERVADFAALNTVSAGLGSFAFVLSEDALYVYSTTGWVRVDSSELIPVANHLVARIEKMEDLALPQAIGTLENSLSNTASKEDLATVWRTCESTFALRSDVMAQSSYLTSRLANVSTTADLQAVWRSCEHLFALKADTVSQLTLLSNKVDDVTALKAGLLLLASQLTQYTKQAEFTQLAGRVSNNTEAVAELKENSVLVTSQFSKYAIQTDMNQLGVYTTNQIDAIKINTVDVVVSSAELLVLNAIPKTLLTAPGAGKYIEVVRVEFFYDFNAAAYAATAGKDVSLEYVTSGQLISVAASGVLDQVSDQRRCLNHSTNHLVGVNEAVLLKMVGGEVTTGNSPLKVRLGYRIVDVLV